MSDHMPVPSEQEWTESDRQWFERVRQLQAQIQTLEAERALKAPYFQCICGAKAMPLTDDTECDCGDIYEQEWTRIEQEPVALQAQLAAHERTIAELRKALEKCSSRISAIIDSLAPEVPTSDEVK